LDELPTPPSPPPIEHGGGSEEVEESASDTPTAVVADVDGVDGAAPPETTASSDPLLATESFKESSHVSVSPSPSPPPDGSPVPPPVVVQLMADCDREDAKEKALELLWALFRDQVPGIDSVLSEQQRTTIGGDLERLFDEAFDENFGDAVTD